MRFTCARFPSLSLISSENAARSAIVAKCHVRSEYCSGINDVDRIGMQSSRDGGAYGLACKGEMRACKDQHDAAATHARYGGVYRRFHADCDLRRSRPEVLDALCKHSR